MQRGARIAFTFATSSAFGLLGALPSACGEAGDSGTSGKRIVLDAKVTSSDAKTPFTNAHGWNVTLTKAVIATGPLYYFDGATIFSSNAPPPKKAMDRFEELFAVRAAFAHPGHYIPGDVRGELLGASSVSLLGETALGTGDGVSGVVRSATFSFHGPAEGPLAADLGSHVAVLEGAASKDRDTRVFRAEIDPSDLANTKQATQIEGCPFQETQMEADGTVTVNVKVAAWFDQVEFDSLPIGSDGKPAVMPSAAIARKELVRGMKEGLSYAFTYAPK